MAHLFSDGFTAYSVRADLDAVYTREGTDPNLRLITAGGPSENGSLRLGGVNRNEAGIYRDIGATVTKGFLGFWFQFNNFDTTDDIDDMILYFASTTTARMSLHLESDGSLKIRRTTNSTILFDSANTLQTADGEQHFLFRGIEYKIEIMINAQNLTGSFELRVNDEIWGFIDGTADLVGTFNRFYFKTGQVGSGADFEISDVYFLDDSGAIPSNATFLGSRWKIEVLRPTAESATINFTPSTGTDNSALVDDAPRHNADADYNDSTGNAQIDRFTTTNTLDGGEVHNVKVVNVARHTGTAQNFRAKIFENATGADGADEALSATFAPFFEDFDTNPDTTEQWLAADVEACEFGYESRA